MVHSALSTWKALDNLFLYFKAGIDAFVGDFFLILFFLVHFNPAYVIFLKAGMTSSILLTGTKTTVKQTSDFKQKKFLSLNWQTTQERISEDFTLNTKHVFGCWLKSNEVTNSTISAQREESLFCFNFINIPSHCAKMNKHKRRKEFANYHC